MVKQKLIEKRKAKGLSQEEVANLLGMEQSTYSRKENGHTAIHPTEWEKLAKALDTTVDEIFEPQNGISFVNNDDSKSNNCVGSQNNYFNIPEYILNSLQKYIEKLEQENKELKEKANL